jgi:hypothetical protein
VILGHTRINFPLATRHPRCQGAARSQFKQSLHSLLVKPNPHCRWLTLGFGTHRFDDRGV